MSVKITIPTYLATLLAPHTCCGCNIVGTLLCDNCKNDIIRDPLYRCLECGQPTLSGQCQTCSLPYAAAWCALQREGALERLIDRYKFERAQAAQHTLADLLDAVTPPLPADTIIVPIPTIPAHQRQRGYDHCRLLAQAFARLRGLPCQPVLTRAQHSVQLGSSRTQRQQQARQAFTCSRTLPSEVTYCLIDDISTTGATIRYASRCLRTAGARQVIAVVVAHQPFG